MGPRPKPKVSAPPGRRSRPRRGPLGWLMLVLGLTLVAGATTFLVQSIQCNCPTRVHCSDIPREKRTIPCLSEELDNLNHSIQRKIEYLNNLYYCIKRKIEDLMKPPPDPRCQR